MDNNPNKDVIDNCVLAFEPTWQAGAAFDANKAVGMTRP